MFVLGIDPGLGVTGYALVTEDAGTARAVAAGVIKTDPGQSLARRLLELYDDVTGLIAEHRPDAMAIEEVFVNRNLQTAMSVGRASGVIVLAAALAGVATYEYTPSGVKNAVAGFGGATKDQVRRVLARRLRLDDLPGPADAADAVAVALCHLQSGKLRQAVGDR